MVGKTATPVIDKEIILIPFEGLPDVLPRARLVQADVGRYPEGQQGMQPPSLLPVVVNNHVGHVLQTLVFQLEAQPVQPGRLHQTEQSAGL